MKRFDPVNADNAAENIGLFEVNIDEIGRF